MKILVDENIPLGFEAFEQFGHTILFAGRSLTQKDILESEADALIIRSITKVNAGLLDQTHVKFVGTATIGTDHVDQNYLLAKGIGFSSAPGCNSNSVGEYVVTALLRLQHEKNYSLEGKTLGIIGYGHVGKNLAIKAEALGLKLLINDPPLQMLTEKQGNGVQGNGEQGNNEQGNNEQGNGEKRNREATYSEMSELFKKADIISLHVPLTKSGPYRTLGLVDQKFLQSFSKPIVLINTCRGEVIDESVLSAAKDAGQIQHLVLDVFNHEPNIDPIIAALADIITPHIAGYSHQGKLNGTTQIAAAFCKHFGFESSWQPHFAPPPNPIIHYTDADFLYKAVTTAYAQNLDEEKLRSSLKNANPGQAFDLLRKQYPVRHEFTEYNIDGLSSENRNISSQLLKLGFKLK